MSWLLKMGKICLVYLIAAFSLASCGFQPVYQQDQAAIDTPDLLARIEIVTPPGRDGDRLKAALEDHFYHGLQDMPPRYRLETTLETASAPFIIEPDGLATRFELTLRSRYRLLRQADDKELHQGRLQRKVGYNVSEDIDFSTFIAQRDAINRGIDELAQDYRLRISGLFAGVMAKR